MAKKTSIMDNLLDLPSWSHLMICLMILISPVLIGDKFTKSPNVLLNRVDLHLSLITQIIGLFFFLLFLICLYKKYIRNKLFNHQHNLKNLYDLTWQEFEILVTEVFFRAGFRVKRRGGNHADGGIDLEAYKNGQKIIIQCKHWKSKNVGVAVVREMFGVGIHERANAVYIVTCGYFTKDAKEFAEGKPMHLMHGYKLLEWIKDLQK